MRSTLVSALVLLAVAAIALPADAGSARAAGGRLAAPAGIPPAQPFQSFNAQPFQFNPTPFQFGAPATPPPAVVHRHRHSREFVPQTVIVAGAPAYSCSVPGYWTYQWVPQVYSSTVWVPGQWSPDGTWIDGHYQSESVASGYWQPIWVPDQNC